jgi:hypothetical protein
MQLYIYDKRTLEIVGRPHVKDAEAFELEPNKFFPSFDPEIHVAKFNEISNPKLENDDVVEKTRVDLINEGIQTLYDGEILVDNEIEYVAVPEGILKAKWTGTEWIENASIEDFESEVDKLIDNFIELDKKKLEREAYGFDTKELEEKIGENFLKRMEYVEKIYNLELASAQE